MNKESIYKIAREQLDNYIEEQGMRKTPERYAILNAVLNMDGHHGADEIMAMLTDGFRISRATIFSTLNLFDEIGIVFSHQIHGKTIYESACGRKPHHHYICKGCYRIWDFTNDELTEAVAVSRTPRFKKIRCAVYIYGLCDTCQARLYRLKKKTDKQKDEGMTREEQRFARIDDELAKASEWFK